MVAKRVSPTNPGFVYTLAFARIDFRKQPELYRVGRGEQGVLLVEPYKSELLPLWRFRTPALAHESSAAILRRFHAYGYERDFVGMDMARKFLQMGYTRARRYANRRSGRKYRRGRLLPRTPDAEKARAARIFYAAWRAAAANPLYRKLAHEHRRRTAR